MTAVLPDFVHGPEADPSDTDVAAPAQPRDPRWVRPAFAVLLVATAVLYLWGLGASGWANSFYTAAVQAGSHSWKAMFFGSFDSSSFITVDKPPASLWVMELSARIFGFSSWSVLVPQALEGVAAVALLYATVKRRFGAAAALMAGMALATTPVATLMFRFNNPDALLVLLLVAAAYALVRALESTSARWLIACAVFVGTGFLTKMMQAFVVVPVLGLVYLVCADTPLRRRVLQLGAALGALVVASGWWVAIVELTPASARPYIGGSQDNSLLNLIFGYNGLGRITGNETGSVVAGGQGGAGMWGATGITRMFNSEFGGQISWLIPAALVLLAAMLWLSRRAPRVSQQRAQVAMWGGWLLVTGLTFSYARGIVHPYYSVALAPAIAALVGIGAAGLWAHRRGVVARSTLAAAVGVTGWWTWVLLDRSPTWHPALRTAVAAVAAVAVVGILGVHRVNRRVGAAVAAAAVLSGIAGPAAYAVQTAATPHTGSIPSAGPAVAGGRGPGGFGGPPPGVAGTFRGRAGGGGGLLDAAHPSAAVVAALQAGSSSYTWVAAAVGANNAAGYQLASDRPVLAIGGFNGSDPTPTLAEFQALVAAGKIHYFVGGGMSGFRGRPGGGGQGTGSAITQWVEQNYTATTVGGVTLYDLNAATG